MFTTVTDSAMGQLPHVSWWKEQEPKIKSKPGGKEKINKKTADWSTLRLIHRIACVSKRDASAAIQHLSLSTQKKYNKKILSSLQNEKK
jgi:hypothetical protein